MKHRSLFRVIGALVAVGATFASTAWAANKVTGVVKDKGGNPLAGVTVTVLDVDAKAGPVTGTAQVMGTAVTAANGTFAVTYAQKAWDTEPGLAARPDILAVATVKRAGRSVVVARSKVAKDHDPTKDLKLALQQSSAGAGVPTASGSAMPRPGNSTLASIEAMPMDELHDAWLAAWQGPKTGAQWTANYNALKAKANQVVVRINAVPYSGKNTGLVLIFKQLVEQGNYLKSYVEQTATYDAQAMDWISTSMHYLRLGREAFIYYAKPECATDTTVYPGIYQAYRCDCITQVPSVPSLCYPYCQWSEGGCEF